MFCYEKHKTSAVIIAFVRKNIRTVATIGFVMKNRKTTGKHCNRRICYAKTQGKYRNHSFSYEIINRKSAATIGFVMKNIENIIIIFCYAKHKQSTVTTTFVMENIGKEQ